MVVRLLLGLGPEDINPNMLDNAGQTPLLWAAGNGHDGVVELLLGRVDVNPDTPDSCGQMPLSLAAENGHGGVAKLLLGRGDVNLGFRIVRLVKSWRQDRTTQSRLMLMTVPG